MYDRPPEYNYILDSYQDRKKLKWMGFFLSDHTSQLAFEEAESLHVWQPKTEMSEEAIGLALLRAYSQQLTVTIQKKENDIEGHFLSDVIGKVEGYQNNYVFVDGNRISLDNIRNVEVEGQIYT